MRGRRIPIALPNTGALARRKNTICKRAIVVGLIVLFVVLQVHILNSDSKDTPTAEVNDSAAAAAILSMVPPVFHKFLTTKRKNSTIGHNGTQTQNVDLQSNINISETVRMIARYNEMQTILNDDIFEPLQNDTVIIVVQDAATLQFFNKKDGKPSLYTYEDSYNMIEVKTKSSKVFKANTN